jgi:hypothetical protein
MNEEIAQLQRRIGELQAELTALKSTPSNNSRRRQITTAVMTALSITAVYFLLNFLGGAFIPDYFVHSLGGVTLKDLEHVTVENLFTNKLLYDDTKQTNGDNDQVFTSPNMSNKQQLQQWKVAPPTREKAR